MALMVQLGAPIQIGSDLLRWASLPHSLEWGWGAAAPASLLRNVLLSLLPVPFLSHPHYKDFVIN